MVTVAPRWGRTELEHLLNERRYRAHTEKHPSNPLFCGKELE